MARTRAVRLAVVVAFVVGLVVTGAGTAQAATYALRTTTWGAWTVYSQQESNWCWAAATKAAIQKRTGSSPSECTIVKRGKRSSTCANVTGTLYDMSRAMSEQGLKSTVGLTRPSFDMIRETTVGGHGILARVVWKEGGKSGHIAPIIGSTSGKRIQITYIRTTSVSTQWITYDQFAKGTHGLGSPYSPSGGFLKA